MQPVPRAQCGVVAVTLSGIPRSALLAAANRPENASSRTALLKAAGIVTDTGDRKGSSVAQGAGEGARKGRTRRGGEGVIVPANLLLTPPELAETNVLVVVLPLPPKELSPNARVHWAKKARAVREYRALAINAAFCAGIAAAIYTPGWERAEVQATFYFRQRRTRDADNLLASLKPALDSLADVGIVGNDSGLTHLPVRLEIDRERPRVELTIRRT